MLRAPGWTARFTADFLPNGFGGVLQAMGLTFIAFEGYEIIAQSGEEVVNPKRNVPRAVFLAIGIAVALYLLISFVALGATTALTGLQVYEYLGLKKELGSESATFTGAGRPKRPMRCGAPARACDHAAAQRTPSQCDARIFC